MKLIDEIRLGRKFVPPPCFSGGFMTHWMQTSQVVIRDMRELLPQSPVVVIDNVADYFYVMLYDADDKRPWGSAEFPNIAPPWQSWWAEFEFPRRFGRPDKTETFDERLRMGFFVYDGTRSISTAARAEPGYANAKWISGIQLFIGYQSGPIHGPVGPFYIPIDVDGHALDRLMFLSTTTLDPVDGPIVGRFIRFLYPLLLAITFLHCKNVTIEDNPVPAPLAKKFEKKNGIKPSTHKTLIIEPLKQTLRREGRADTEGLKKALHICRGHFADYTEGRGLFGKYHGTFWMPMHVRGAKKSEDEKPGSRNIEIKI